MKNISAGQVRRIFMQGDLCQHNAILNKLGNQRTDWLAAASPGNIAVGE